MKVVLALLVALAVHPASGRPQELGPKRAPKLPRQERVEVSLTTLAPEEIQAGKEPNQAKVTIQVYHQCIVQGQTEAVDLEVGNYYTAPPGASATYTPAVQRVTLSGGAGVVTKSVKLSAPSCPSGSTKCTITVGATLSNPSPGLSIRPPDPVTNGQATLTVNSP